MTDEERTVIAIVGGGQGGTALIKDLLEVPGVELKYVFDINPHAPGVLLAKELGIACYHTEDQLKSWIRDPAINIILEVTGKIQVQRKLQRLKLPSCSLIGSSTTKIIFHLLDAEQKVAKSLDQCRLESEDRVLERTKQLQDLNQELIAKIKETEELNHILQKINDEKTSYLLKATHQLKAPFAAIQSYAELLIEGYCGPLSDEVRDVILKIRERCEFLSTCIKEMLELSNLKTWVKENLEMKSCNIDAIVRSVIETHKIISAKRAIRLIYDSQSPQAKIKAHPDQIQMLVAIFLENAINYSYDHGDVIISLHQKGKNKLELTIKDSGIGIPKNHQDKIFQEYFRCNNAVKKHNNGTGLGLAIAKKIVEIQNFNLSIKSELGQGTLVTLSMPITT
jgi:signal transduction histidine kinase